MLAEGMSNKDIARHLEVSDNTVKFHLSSIFGKLGATSRMRGGEDADNDSATA